MDDKPPNWDKLYEIASAQDGHFTAKQSQEAGYYPQLLTKHIQNGKLIRIRRGVYRIVHFPPNDHENLTVIWLWSECHGVFSHETALALHHLSDVLPTLAHMTLPSSESKRRLRVPSGVEIHFGDVEEHQRQWVGCLPVTSPARTLNDCAESNFSPDLLSQAIQEGLSRGLFTSREVSSAKNYLSEFNGKRP
ncbi:MAG: putative transcriptional regulator of viral defense system [Planctomycetota bacterium]|jgi:predicted transcriptional regulator of viral defense system